MGFCRPGETGLPERLNAQPASLYQHCGERLDLWSHLTHHNPPGETRSVLRAPVGVSVNEPCAASSILGIITMVQAPGPFAAHKNLTFSQCFNMLASANGAHPQFFLVPGFTSEMLPFSQCFRSERLTCESLTLSQCLAFTQLPGGSDSFSAIARYPGHPFQSHFFSMFWTGLRAYVASGLSLRGTSRLILSQCFGSCLWGPMTRQRMLGNKAPTPHSGRPHYWPLQTSTCNLQLSTFNLQLSTFNLQLSTCNLQQPPPEPLNDFSTTR